MPASQLSVPEFDIRGWHLIVVAGLLGSLATAEGGAAVRKMAPAISAGTRFRECRDCPEMIVVPAGTFTMGSPKSEPGRFGNESPQHPVTIAHPLAIGVEDVTRAQYRRFARATRRAPIDDCRVYDGTTLVRVANRNWLHPNYRQTRRDPVVCVTWNDAHAYVEWLNGQVDRLPAANRLGPYRLPTEAEWEYAARGGTTTPYYWGTTIHRGDANYGPDEPVFAPKALGADRWEYSSPGRAFPANPFGLFDMAGNVWQFVEDCWHPDYVGAPDDGSARIDAKCEERVVRGGSWFKPPTGERSAKRGEGKPVDMSGSNEIGFRVVRDLDPR